MPLDIYIGLVFTAVAIMLLIRHRHSNAVKGIAVGIGLLVFNLMFFFAMMGVISYFSLLVVPISYYYAGKYCEKRWKKPSWEWGFWLTLPIIGFTVIWYTIVFSILKYSNVSLAGSFILIALIITYFVLLLVSSYGGYVGAKSVQQEEEISE